MKTNEAGFSLAKWAEAAGLPLDWAMCKNMTWIEALKHSLQKWRALREIPDYIKAGRKLDDGDMIVAIDASTCALCQKAKATRFSMVQCARCPLRLYTGRCSNSQYSSYTYHGNPEPMIGALETCLADVEAGRLVPNNFGVFEFKEPRA